MAIPRAVEWRFVLAMVGRALLPIWFITYSALTLSQYADKDYVGIDVLLYRNAALAVLAGDDPWAIQSTGLAFAGPPMTLLFYLPTALLTLPAATVIGMSVGVVAGIWAIRRLELPLWWVFFPPIFESIIVGNPDVVVLALLLVRGPLAGLAGGLKVYAVIPLVAQRRWRALMVFAATVGLSLPLVPQFVASSGTVMTVLDQQTGGISAWGTYLLVPVAVALVVLRRRGAEWLVVPAVWPNTQGHYGAMALPAIARSHLAAAVFALNVPLAPPLGVIILAVREAVVSRRTGPSTVGPIGPSPR